MKFRKESRRVSLQSSLIRYDQKLFRALFHFETFESQRCCCPGLPQYTEISSLTRKRLSGQFTQHQKVLLLHILHPIWFSAKGASTYSSCRTPALCVLKYLEKTTKKETMKEIRSLFLDFHRMSGNLFGRRTFPLAISSHQEALSFVRGISRNNSLKHLKVILTNGG